MMSVETAPHAARLAKSYESNARAVAARPAAPALRPSDSVETDEELSRKMNLKRKCVAVDAMRRQPGSLTLCPKWVMVGF